MQKTNSFQRTSRLQLKFNSLNCGLLASLLLMAFVFLAGCATQPNFGDAITTVNGKTSPAPVAATTDSVTTSTENGSSSGTELVYRGKKIEHSNFDIPVEMNRPVEKWIDYFTGRGRSRFESYLERSEYFIPFLKPILKNAKAPEDLVYLAMIESGFNNNARSHSRAVGAWQFMTATGRRYGLDVNWWIDERRDVEKSTVAAIQYLKELNGMFGNWYLAAAAYNAGEAKIQRAIKKYHTNDFWELCRGRYLRAETKGYVPKLIAAAIVSKNRKEFGFEESYTKIKNVSAALVSAKAEEDDDLERLPDQLETEKPAGEKQADKGKSNPEDVKEAKAEPTTNGVPTEPMVEVTKDSPADPDEEAMLAQDSVESMLRNLSNPVRTPHVNKNGEVNGDILTEVEVPSPADLFKVSSAAGLTYMEFKSMNPELLRWITPPLMKTYKIRMPLSHKDAFVKKYFDPTYQRDVNFLTYKARKGDSPKRIAKRFGISTEPVAEMNDVPQNSSIMPGKMVSLPIPSDFVRSIASLKSLDLLDPVYPKRHHYRRRHRHRSASDFQNQNSSRRI